MDNKYPISYILKFFYRKF